MRIPDPKANTTTEAYLAYKAGYLEQSELKPKLYEPYLHFDGWLAYWAGLTGTYPNKGAGGKNLFNKQATPFRTGTNFYNEPVGNKVVAETSSDVTITQIENGFSVTTTGSWEGAWIITEVKPSTTYHLKYTQSGSDTYGRTTYYVLDRDYVVTEKHPVSSDDFTVNVSITTTSGSKYIALAVGSSGASTTTVTDCQLEEGSSATEYEPYSAIPEMLTDEEALVAYLSGVTDTYPESIKDPEDVRITGYLRHLVSARWPEPDYPVNNEEFYLSTMKPPVVTNDTPSAEIELDDTAEAPFIDVKAYGDMSQTTYTGKNLMTFNGHTPAGQYLTVTSVSSNAVTLTPAEGAQQYANVNCSYDLTELGLAEGDTITISLNIDGTYATGDHPARMRVYYDSTSGTGIAILKKDANVATITIPADVTKLRLYFYVSDGAIPEEGSTATFSNIQIEKSATATAFEPYVGRIPAPNPDYPQPVNVVTGRQVVKVNGKNLFNLDQAVTVFENPDGVVQTGGATYSNGVVNMTWTLGAHGRRLMAGFRPKLVEGETYTLSASVYLTGTNETKNVAIGSISSWAQVPIESKNTWLRVSKTFTATSADVADSRMLIEPANSGNTMQYKDVQLVEGSSDVYTPYESGSYEINLYGKNLFDRSSAVVDKVLKWADADYNNEVGSLVDARCLDVQEGDKFSSNYAFCVFFYDENEVYIGVLFGNGTVGKGTGGYFKTITVPSGYGIKKMRIEYRKSQSGNPSDMTALSNIMFNYGATVAPYVPYNAIELCKLGDYQDYIYQDADGDWYVKKNVGKYVFKGTENWQTVTVRENTMYYYINSSFPLNGGAYTIVPSASDYFTPTSFSNALSQGSTADGVFFFHDSNHYAGFKYNSIGSLQDWQTWLVSHNTTMWYPLATATDTLITDDDLIAQLNALKEGGSYEGKTYITVTSTAPNLPALLKVEAGEYR